MRASLTQERQFDPGDEPFLKVLRPMVEAYFAVLRRSDRHVRSLGLTPSQFDVIATLGDTQGMSCRELSEMTLVTKGTLTGVLDRLEAKGLTERIPSKNDRRSTMIRLTAKGDRLFRKVFPAHIKFLKPYYERALTAGQMKELSRMLLTLKQSFEKE
jgi:DNA-binding MarR family transcriptional regulator